MPPGLPEKTMKKLLLLDADVVIDLHTIGLFDRIIRNYAVHVTKTVLKEAVYFKRSGERIKIDIRDRVTVMEDISLDYLRTVQGEAKEARLAIDPGELESIACLIREDETGLILCTCDQAAIRLLSFMNLEQRSLSLEKALRTSGYHKKNLYPRHLEETFKTCIQEGKVLRIQLKKIT